MLQKKKKLSIILHKKARQNALIKSSYESSRAFQLRKGEDLLDVKTDWLIISK